LQHEKNKSPVDFDNDGPSLAVAAQRTDFPQQIIGKQQITQKQKAQSFDWAFCFI
jgi:hypothetical protein